MVENVERFIFALTASLADGTFVKLSLGNYKGSEPHLQKILIRQVTTKKGTRLYFLYRGETRDTAKNFAFDEGARIVRDAIADGFSSGHLFTTTNDYQLEIGSKGKARLNIAKPTFKQAPPVEHDRQKTSQVDANSFYLKALGIADDTGRIRDKQQDKWRQINKFVEVLTNLVDRSALRDHEVLSMVDMGSGKGYLTFAAYDHFKNLRGVDIRVTGVETRPELVMLCNDIARASEFSGLNFVEGTIDSFDMAGADILVALHACNTATDDAIYKGIAANAELIVVSPCCHQEIRHQIEPPEMLRDILKHGVMLERTAETITDGLRSLLLERSGYATKLFEFVPTEHTPKNNMLVGTRLETPRDTEPFNRQISEIKQFYGVREQRLEQLLGMRRVATG